MDAHANKHVVKRRSDQGGYVLLVVTVFAFVILITSAAVVSTTSSEAKLSHHQHSSEEAFFLADSAIERARARLMQDRGWRDGWTDVSFGNGTYSLAIADTTISGYTTDVVRMSASGQVSQAQRRIEMIAEIPPSGLGLSMLIGGDAICIGRICVNGRAHVNGFAWFGFMNRHFQCGTLTDGFVITPPPIFTAPAQFPDDTYYFVRGTMIGGVPQARIFDRHGTDITTALGDSLTGVTSYNPITSRFVYNFHNHTTVAYYFDQTTGIFSRTAGDVSVVINFGEVPLIDPPGDDGTSTIYIQGNNSSVINSTIINTRFEGVTTAQQTDPGYWNGGLTLFYNTRLLPYNGLGIVAEFLFAGSNAELGNATWPALTYLTGSWNASFNLFGHHGFSATGSFITLGDFYSLGRFNFTYDSGFMERIPDAILQQWPGRVSGTLKVLSWNEPSSN
ncbi:hypothetical protein KKG45_05110 [bacterium]|nr:hypothetical protein [bacterium]MBU1072608.1 hypothetical protein [bacterium]MBU1675747.1 hypothetical protein [bacterium]